MEKKKLWEFLSLTQVLILSFLLLQNTASEQMEMTTPVFTRKVQSGGEKMDMTTPVITKQASFCSK